VLFFPAEKFEPWYVRHLARSLGDGQPFLAMRHQLTDPTQFDSFAEKFVQLIRAMRRDGPMVIAGHCYGGLLAYEVGRRLMEAGCTGIAVVLINVNAPGYPKVQLRRYVRQVPRVLDGITRGRVATLLRDAIAHLNFLRQKSYVIPQDVAEAGGPPSNQLSPAGALFRTYPLQHFPGRVTHILALDQEVSTEILDDPRLGWRDLLPGAVDEFPVHGDHHSLFDEQNAPKVAETFRDIIARLAGRGGL
jgi:thioesterase domain-containing protein